MRRVSALGLVGICPGRITLQGAQGNVSSRIRAIGTYREATFRQSSPAAALCLRAAGAGSAQTRTNPDAFRRIYRTAPQRRGRSAIAGGGAGTEGTPFSPCNPRPSPCQPLQSQSLSPSDVQPSTNSPCLPLRVRASDFLSFIIIFLNTPLFTLLRCYLTGAGPDCSLEPGPPLQGRSVRGRGAGVGIGALGWVWAPHRIPRGNTHGVGE